MKTKLLLGTEASDRLVISGLIYLISLLILDKVEAFVLVLQ